MKKTGILLFITLYSFFAMGQTDSTRLGDLHRGAEKTKTANRWDAFGNFLQLAGNDLAGDNKGIQFKGNLFALLSWDTAKCYKSPYYLKRTWERNMEIQSGIKLGKNNSVTSINLGINWAILNLRDKSSQDILANNHKEIDLLTSLVSQIGFIFTQKMSETKPDSSDLFFSSLTLYTSNGKLGHKDSVLLKSFIRVLDDSVNRHKDLHALGRGYFAAVKYTHTLYDSLAELVSRRPLLTFNPALQYDPVLGKVNGVRGAAEYIIGLGKIVNRKPWELDMKVDYVVGDTIPNKVNLNRQVLDGIIGVNKVLMTQSDKKTSVIEFKVGGEMDVVTGNLNKGEDQYRYFANVTLRVRAGKALWIPVTLKYDLKTSNLLGFLNLSVNLDSNSGKSTGTND